MDMKRGNTTNNKLQEKTFSIYVLLQTYHLSFLDMNIDDHLEQLLYDYKTWKKGLLWFVDIKKRVEGKKIKIWQVRLHFWNLEVKTSLKWANSISIMKRQESKLDSSDTIKEGIKCCQCISLKLVKVFEIGFRKCYFSFSFWS